MKDYILDIIFPRHCLGCDILLGNECQSYVCRLCLKAISFTNGFACAFCKSPVRAGKTCVYCAKNHHLDRLLVATSYENPLVEKILKAVKYRFVRSLADDVADLMIKYLEKRAGWLAGTIEIIPVPLHRRRLNWRGFNQAEIIAEKIGWFFGWPSVTGAQTRTRNRGPQADMPDKLSRIENAKNLFQIYNNRPDFIHQEVMTVKSRILDPYRDRDKSIDFTGKIILLIDDISTTGSTLNDCARALKGAGAKEVIGFVFARGKLDSKSKI